MSCWRQIGSSVMLEADREYSVMLEADGGSVMLEADRE